MFSKISIVIGINLEKWTLLNFVPLGYHLLKKSESLFHRMMESHLMLLLLHLETFSPKKIIFGLIILYNQLRIIMDGKHLLNLRLTTLRKFPNDKMILLKNLIK